MQVKLRIPRGQFRQSNKAPKAETVTDPSAAVTLGPTNFPTVWGHYRHFKNPPTQPTRYLFPRLFIISLVPHHHHHLLLLPATKEKIKKRRKNPSNGSNSSNGFRIGHGAIISTEAAGPVPTRTPPLPPGRSPFLLHLFYGFFFFFSFPCFYFL